MTRVLVIDNYDSFTWNLVHLLGPLVDDVEVVRNDAIDHRRGAGRSRRTRSCCRPGPARPTRPASASISYAAPRREIPTFGVCLGLQAIGQAFGGTVSRAPLPMHGKVSEVEHRGEAVFRGINGPFKATRYHSLIVDRETCPTDLAVTAQTGDGLDHGPVAPLAADPRRAVPPGEHPVRARRHDHAQFLRSRGGVEREAPAAGHQRASAPSSAS